MLTFLRGFPSENKNLTYVLSLGYYSVRNGKMARFFQNYAVLLNVACSPATWSSGLKHGIGLTDF